jgi:hypothetical protein
VVYLSRIGRHAEALPLARRCVDSFTVTLGSNHPYTVTATVNLSNCLAVAHDLTKARELDQAAYEQFAARLGRDHPDTLVTGANLARTLEGLGQREAAQALLGQVLPVLTRRLGEQHPTLIAVQNGERVDREIEPQPT